MDCGCLSIPVDRESAPSDASNNPADFQQQTCDRFQLAPILQFGSGFVHPDVMPTMVTMPIWTHLRCFETFRYDGKVCNKFSPMSATNRFGIYFEDGEHHSDLIPRIIWRGSDYPFLKCRQGGGFKWNITPMDIPGPNTGAGLVDGLTHLWDKLNPRWKAVTLSLQAELEAKNANPNDIKPWVDFKFTTKERPGSESQRWESFVKNGLNIVSDSYIDANEFATFKYYADFGGGGGTTWSGTHTKLALPGVLLHHETPTYDWWHEELIEYVHYIPVSTELSDLREKYEWAEAHQDEVRAISEASTAFVKYMGSSEYWNRSFDRFFVKRLNSVIEAYRPGKTKDEREFLNYAESRFGVPLEKIGICDGKQDCKWKEK